MHLLVDFPPKVALSKLVNSVSRACRRGGCGQRFRLRTYRDHLWSPSYFAASCGGAPLSIIRESSTSSGGPPRAPSPLHRRQSRTAIPAVNGRASASKSLVKASL